MDIRNKQNQSITPEKQGTRRTLRNKENNTWIHQEQEIDKIYPANLEHGAKEEDRRGEERGEREGKENMSDRDVLVGERKEMRPRKKIFP